MRITSRVSCICIAAITAVAAAPNALATLTIQSATLNGGSSVTVQANATITAAVTVVTSASNWKGTQWNISSNQCVDTTDHNVNGTFTESFSITAPGSAGTYSVSFTAISNDNCTGTTSS